jgi:trans-aconitate 2-methyltransferase
MTWDPTCYDAYADHRLRPGLELMSRIVIEPSLVYDLGCGTGELTHHLSRRWPGAKVIGIDNSEEMVSRAHSSATVTFLHQTIEDWVPQSAPDLIFSNAALHWVANHESLFPRLLNVLRPGGVLAVQMPDNWEEPTHVVIDEEISRRGWKTRLEDHILRTPVAPIEQYLGWLAGAGEIDAWRTTYYQSMSGIDPVLRWVRGTVLVPVRPVLTDDEFQSLETALAEKYRSAYPPRPGGSTVMPMSRLFIVATR